MATDILNCCQCPEPPGYDPEVDPPLTKYNGKCNCPVVVVVCVSNQKNATLCGYVEYTGYESTPAKFYRKKTLSAGYETYAQYRCSEFCPSSHFPIFNTRETTTQYNLITEYDSSCVKQELSETLGVLTTTMRGSGSSPNCGGGTSTSTSNFDYSNLSPNIIHSAISAEWEDISNTYYSSGDCSGLLSVQFERGLLFNLDPASEDTEAAALARATDVAGTSCSSIYETRTNSDNLIKRTSSYTVTADNLVVGVKYEGCVRIRRRESYSGTLPVGSDTAWYDIEPDTIAEFTATSNQEVVGANVGLPHAQGYEYEVISAHVWPVSAGCDCPTSYIAP